MDKNESKRLISSRPPVVAVLGHVDHGKTTLLDFIRKTKIAAGEHGGITQRIGAYQIHFTNTGGESRTITFIDTPGHEAFAKMRSRGATVADIAILVVAADDSVKPQTKESIEQIQLAGIPMIVAINKVDLPSANIDKTKQDLARNSVQLEGFGGEIPWVAISAKSGTGIPDLLQLILSHPRVKQLTPDTIAPFEGAVIETRMDKGKGMVAAVIVKKGILSAGIQLYSGQKNIGKVRALIDDTGSQIPEANPGTPVEILGFTQLPSVGETITKEPVIRQLKEALGSSEPHVAGLPDFLKPIEEQAQAKLKIILKADTAGSLEAIERQLATQIQFIATGIGEITEADILRAKSSDALVIGFNVSVKSAGLKLATTERVLVRTYTLIYELLDEVLEVSEDLAARDKVMERELGRGQIIAEFPFEGQRVAGVRVISGRIARGDIVKFIHADSEIGQAKVTSMRQGKVEVTKTESGKECGLLLDKKVDFSVGDGIIAVTIG